MKLIVQPNDGMAPLIEAIKRAQKSIQIVIFRFDELAIERALIAAVERGVFVHALIAFTNRGGEKSLRRLEMRFLARGITVARTDDDLVRYHGKILLVDGKELFVLAHNFTHLDIERSRSFGIVTRNTKLVQEAARLFECDTKRQKYHSQSAKLVMSPANARQRLAAFLKGAKRELLIYDIKISDPSMLRILEERKQAGVDVRIIGDVAKGEQLAARSLRNLRLHARVIIRDRKQAFVDSQRIVNELIETFQNDWKTPLSKESEKRKDIQMPSLNDKPKALAKVVAKKIPVAPVVRQVAQVIHKAADVELDRQEVKETVEQAVKSALKKAVKKATAEVVHRAEEIV